MKSEGRHHYEYTSAVLRTGNDGPIIILLSSAENGRSLYREIFLRTLIVSIICVAIDVLSVVAITYQHFIPEWLLETICKTYVVFIVWVEYFALTYVLADLYSEKEYWRAVRKYIILANFASIMVYILPIYYYHEKDVVYTYGASTKMVHDMQIKIVAEGIETKEQLMAMNKIGVDYIQGYYFSKPLLTAEFLEFIKIKRNEEE